VETACDPALDDGKETLNRLRVGLAILRNVLVQGVRDGAVLGKLLANGEIG
jgi:hypothetical protein